jgi:hypothetical protein
MLHNTVSGASQEIGTLESCNNNWKEAVEGVAQFPTRSKRRFQKSHSKIKGKTIFYSPMFYRLFNLASKVKKKLSWTPTKCHQFFQKYL